MYCTQCGRELSEGDRFCPNCGKAVSEPPGAITPEPPPVRRRLERVMSEKKIAGVCAGFARYMELDITLTRIIFIGLAILPPSIGALGYLLGWVAMPRDTDPR